jgi:hypothetical protein
MPYPFKLTSEQGSDVVSGPDVWNGFAETTTAHGVPHVHIATGRGNTKVRF